MGAPHGRLIYVSLGGEPRLAVVELADDGALVARSDMDLALPAATGAMAFGRDSRRLYLEMRPDRLATVALDADGRPALVGITEYVGSPAYLSVARGESILVCAHFGSAELVTHDVSGEPPHRELARVAAAVEPHAALVDPSDRRVYVPHRNGMTTDWFDLADDGSLARQGGLPSQAGDGPRHIVVSPDGAIAWVINEFASSVSAHRRAADGSLERFQTVSTLPEAAGDGAGDGNNICADVHVTPDGRFLYGSNRGHNSLAMFAVASDGSLQPLGTVPAPAFPREFDVSPDGRFVVAGGQHDGNLESYRVAEDGRLESVGSLHVGDDPRWVFIE